MAVFSRLLPSPVAAPTSGPNGSRGMGLAQGTTDLSVHDPHISATGPLLTLFALPNNAGSSGSSHVQPLPDPHGVLSDIQALDRTKQELLDNYAAAMEASCQTDAELTAAYEAEAIESEAKDKALRHACEMHALLELVKTLREKRRVKEAELEADGRVPSWLVKDIPRLHEVSRDRPVALTFPVANARNPYQGFLFRTKHTRKSTRCERIPCMPHPYMDIQSLPKEFHVAQAPHHGASYLLDNLIVLRGLGIAFVVCHAESCEAVDHTLRKLSARMPLEILTACAPNGVGFMYEGSFRLVHHLGWTDFNSKVTGDIPELFEGYSGSASDNSYTRWAMLKAQWFSEKNGLVFRVLEYVSFNEAYFRKLEQLAVPQETQKRSNEESSSQESKRPRLTLAGSTRRLMAW